MKQRVDVEEAARSLNEVDARQRAVVDAVLIPAWYWWLIALLSIGLGAAVDTRKGGVIAPTAVLYGVVVAAASVWMILGRGQAQLSKHLLGDRGALAIVGFVWALVVGTLAIGFGLRALHVSHPAVIACIVCAVGLVIGGPALTRLLRRSMLTERGN
jgi:hypothetical protein